MSPHVIVLGGGVGGMSAAHELAERGFRVTVYDKHGIAGGKARSFGVPNTGTGGRRDLPAEHGFRFFPGFYQHLPDTMKRIPYPGNRQGVLDNLVTATQMQILFNGAAHLVVPARFPTSLEDVRAVLGAANYLTTSVGLTPVEIDFYAERVWQLLTSCEERRADELEGQSWWQYIDAANHSAVYQDVLGGTPRVLVAADPEVANTKTLGDILLQLLFNLTEPGVSADRVLNGPTNAAWIDPWLQYLRGSLGVEYHHHARVTGIECSAGRITGVRIEASGQQSLETADYYVAALPVEKMAALITSAMLQADPTLAGIPVLAGHVDWMTGIQFYLLRELPSVYGHQMYLGTPWALTALSQAQFWYQIPGLARDYGDGTVQTVLSVDISNWNAPGLGNGPAMGKTGKQCSSREQIADEVWAQLKKSLPALRDEDRHPTTPWSLDPAIQLVNGVFTNDEPLLVNRADSWALRPWARTRIPNLFLASDYVRTHTNLATMEAANEAARRAVNAIIDASGARVPPCRLWALHEPVWVKPWRWWDLARYRRGLAWSAELPDFVQSSAQTVLGAAPAAGPGGYADAGVRAGAANGVGVVPPYVQQEVADTVLALGSALERGDVATLRTLLDPAAQVILDGRSFPGVAWLDTLQRLYQHGGRIDVDVRSVERVVPDGRGVAARFVADIVVNAEPPPPSARRGRLDVRLAQPGDRAPGPRTRQRVAKEPRTPADATRLWTISALEYSP